MSAKPYGIIYVVTNLVTGRKYVGQTRRTLAYRWKQHQRTKDCRLLARAIHKYGPDAFRREQIAEAHSQEELNRLEAEWIASLGTLHPGGYNLLAGGRGATFSEETKRVRSAALKRSHNKPETRAKISAVVTRHYENPEARLKTSAALKASHNRPETRAKISARQKQHFENTQVRADLLAASKRYFDTPEAREKQSSARKRYFEANPEERTVVATKTRNQWANPDARATIYAAIKAAGRRKRERNLLESQIRLMNWG